MADDYYLLLLLSMFAVSIHQVLSANDTEVRCPAYCDERGFYQPYRWCTSTDDSPIYCCGHEHLIICCSEPEDDIGEGLEDVTNCARSNWMQYQWTVVVALLGTMVILLALASCCYFCCSAESPTERTPTRRLGLRREATQVSAITDHDTDIPRTFDPSSPNAFCPPDYDSLPKDPPKYGDIFDNEIGLDNMGFQNNEETSGIPASCVGTTETSLTTTAASSTSAPHNEPPPYSPGGGTSDDHIYEGGSYNEETTNATINSTQGAAATTVTDLGQSDTSSVEESLTPVEETDTANMTSPEILTPQAVHTPSSTESNNPASTAGVSSLPATPNDGTNASSQVDFKNMLKLLGARNQSISDEEETDEPKAQQLQNVHSKLDSVEEQDNNVQPSTSTNADDITVDVATGSDSNLPENSPKVHVPGTENSHKDVSVTVEDRSTETHIIIEQSHC